MAAPRRLRSPSPGLASAPRVALDQGALQLDQVVAICVATVSGPAAVAAEVPARYVIAHPHGHQGLHALDVSRVRELEQGLDAAVEVAVHQVGAADVDDRFAAAAEGEDPRVLQEPAEDRTHPDRLRQPFDAGAHGADAANPEVHLDAGAGRAIQRIDQLVVDDGVHLQADVATDAGPRVGDLGLDQVHQARAHRSRRHQEALELAARGPPGQLVEQPRQVLADLRVAGEQTHILIQASGFRVVVAGADVAVATEPLGLLAVSYTHLTLPT